MINEAQPTPQVLIGSERHVVDLPVPDLELGDRIVALDDGRRTVGAVVGIIFTFAVALDAVPTYRVWFEERDEMADEDYFFKPEAVRILGKHRLEELDFPLILKRKVG